MNKTETDFSIAYQQYEQTKLGALLSYNRKQDTAKKALADAQKEYETRLTAGFEKYEAACEAIHARFR